MYCPHCGNKVDGDARSCPFCGGVLPDLSDARALAVLPAWPAPDDGDADEDADEDGCVGPILPSGTGTGLMASPGPVGGSGGPNPVAVSHRRYVPGSASAAAERADSIPRGVKIGIGVALVVVAVVVLVRVAIALALFGYGVTGRTVESPLTAASPSMDAGGGEAATSADVVVRTSLSAYAWPEIAEITRGIEGAGSEGGAVADGPDSSLALTSAFGDSWRWWLRTPSAGWDVPARLVMEHAL